MIRIILILAFVAASGVASQAQTNKTLQGIDVSHYQGQINWTDVAGQGLSFAIAKATQGAGGGDAQFAANWTGMKAAGLIRGAYHFFVVDDDPAAQVSHIMSTVTLEAGDLPIFVDVEAQSYTATKEQFTANLTALLSGIEQATGKTPIIYTEASFWNDAVGQNFSQYPLWVPEYNVSAPTIPTGWGKWTFWQYSQTGSVSGISGDVLLDTFNGDETALQRLAK